MHGGTGGTQPPSNAAARRCSRRARSVEYALASTPAPRLDDRTQRDQSQPPSTEPTADPTLVHTPDEVWRLADAIATVGKPGADGRPTGARYRALVALAGFAPLRPGELCALGPDDAELDGDSPVIVAAFSEGHVRRRFAPDGRARQRKRLKHRGEDEHRIIPLPPDVAEALREHIAAGYASETTSSPLRAARRSTCAISASSTGARPARPHSAAARERPSQPDRSGGYARPRSPTGCITCVSLYTRLPTTPTSRPQSYSPRTPASRNPIPVQRAHAFRQPGDDRSQLAQRRPIRLHHRHGRAELHPGARPASG